MGRSAGRRSHDQQAARLSPAGIEFKRAHLYDINPVGVGAMLAATIAGTTAISGAFGATLQSLAAFLALVVAFVMAPAIAYATKGRFYVARTPRQDWGGQALVRCAICEHQFEPEDMAHCPAYSGPICSLCCSLETRCRDCCKPQARVSQPGPRLAGEDAARLGDSPAQQRCRALSRRALSVRRRHWRCAVARLLPDLARQRNAQSGAEVRALERLLHPDHHCGRDRLAVRPGAGQPAGRGGGNAAADRPADARDRGAQAHRLQAAEGQGGRGGRQQGEEPACRWPEPRAAHPAQRYPRLFAAARARHRTAAPADRGDQGGPAQLRAPRRPDRRPARHLEDRSRPLSTQPQRGAHVGVSRPARRHVSPAGDRQGHRIPLRAGKDAARRRAYR